MLDKYGLEETNSKMVKVGDLFDRLEVLAVGQIPFSYRYMAICRCSCGTEKAIRQDGLTSGAVRSCGCFHKEKVTKHDRSIVKFKSRHGLMMSRCYNEKDSAYKHYGARGVKVCERWHEFNIYAKDIAEGFFKGAELDRIDNDGDYSPENTKWSTKSENCRNRRSNHMITINGEAKCISDWCDEYKIKAKIVYERISSGWNAVDALTKPIANVHDNIILAQAKRWEGHVKKQSKPKRILKTVSYNGKTYTIKELSDFSGVSVKLLNKRIYERNWDIERAVLNKSLKGKNYK